MRAAIVVMAWRNISRNLYRTVLTASAIALGLAALIFLGSFSDGLHGNMQRNFQDSIIGSLQVHGQGFFRRPALERDVPEPARVVALLKQAGIERWSYRLESFGLAAGEATSAGVMLMGMDPAREVRVTRVADKVGEGRFLRPGDKRVCVMGRATARGLGLELGDPVVLLGYDRYGVLSAEEFRLVGIITSGETGLDRGMVITPLTTLQTLLEMSGRVTDIPVRVPAERLESLTRLLRAELPAANYEVMRWYDMFPVMKEWVTLDSGFHAVLSVVVLFIVLAGVLNTVLLTMLERVREFGVLLALGTRPGQIAMMVGLESLFVGIIGVAGGMLLGIAVVWLAASLGIDLGALLGPTARFYVDPVIRPELVRGRLLDTVLAVLLTTLLAALYPAIRAARLQAAQAIRHV